MITILSQANKKKVESNVENSKFELLDVLLLGKQKKIFKNHSKNFNDLNVQNKQLSN